MNLIYSFLKYSKVCNHQLEIFIQIIYLSLWSVFYLINFFFLNELFHLAWDWTNIYFSSNLLEFFIICLDIILNLNYYWICILIFTTCEDLGFKICKIGNEVIEFINWKLFIFKSLYFCGKFLRKFFKNTWKSI